jgi:hypothetical protein
MFPLCGLEQYAEILREILSRSGQVPRRHNWFQIVVSGWGVASIVLTVVGEIPCGWRVFA